MDEMTIEFWMYPRAHTANYVRAISKGGYLDNGWTMYTGVIGTNTLYPYFGQNGGTGWSGAMAPGIAYQFNQWQHVAVTVKLGSSGKSYLNGISLGSVVPATYYPTTTRQLRVGLEGGSPFNGMIDDVRIYNYARTQKQIVEDMLGSPKAVSAGGGNAVGYWKLDEGYGGAAYDSGPNKINGTISNGTWTNSGKFGKAQTFGATTSVTATITDPAYSNTLSLWVNPTTSVASKTLVTAAKLTTDSSSRPVYGGCTGTALTLSQWTHIAAMSDGSGSCKIYQNGIQTASSTTGVTFGTSVNIGASSFTGSIDEVKIYSYPLTADEIKLDYNKGSSMVLGTLGSSSSYQPNANSQIYCVPGDSTSCAAPVGEWNFEEGTTGTSYDISGNG